MTMIEWAKTLCCVPGWRGYNPIRCAVWVRTAIGDRTCSIGWNSVTGSMNRPSQVQVLPQRLSLYLPIFTRMFRTQFLLPLLTHSAVGISRVCAGLNSPVQPASRSIYDYVALQHQTKPKGRNGVVWMWCWAWLTGMGHRSVVYASPTPHAKLSMEDTPTHPSCRSKNGAFFQTKGQRGSGGK